MDLLFGFLALIYLFFITFKFFLFLIISFIFYFNNFYFIYFFFLSFSLSFFFSPFSSEPCGCHRVFVLQPGVRPVPLRRESRVQDIGPPETSWLHVISNGESSPRDLHLSAKIQLHSTNSKLQCWTPHAKQLAKQEHNPTH